MGKIWYPPPGAFDDCMIELEFVYGEDLNIGFTDTCYFTASNQHTFLPILPTGNFVAGTSLGPYFAAPENSTVLLTSFDEATRKTYQYRIKVAPPLSIDPPSDAGPSQ